MRFRDSPLVVSPEHRIPAGRACSEAGAGASNACKGQETVLRNRVAIRFTVTGDLRFISHHDTVRVFARAIARAGLPIRYSEGFNPRPRMSVALPRAVGVASADELLVLELVSPVDDVEVAARLSAEVPKGISIVSANPVPDGDRRLPTAARYRVDTAEADRALIDEHARLFMASESVEIERWAHGESRSKRVDIRPYVEAIDVTEDEVIWSQLITTTGTVRPNEMLSALGLGVGEYLHRIQRLSVTYQP